MNSDSDHRRFFFAAQKRNFSRCIPPTIHCDDTPIRAHSIQNARVLDLVQTDSHVIMPRYRIRNGKPAIEFAKIGRNEASTFTGLCAKHDTDIFAIIDNEPLDIESDEHLNLLAYRSVMREMQVMIETGGRLWSIHDDYVKAGLITADDITAASIAAIDTYKKAQNIFRYRSKYFDSPHLAGHNADLVHSVLELPNQPPVLAASTLFSTGFTDEGDLIGPTLNIVPLQNNRMVVALSCPTEQEDPVRKSLETVCQADDDKLKYEISKLIIQLVDNFVLSPEHFHSWSAEKQARIVREFEKSLSGSEPVEDHEDLMLF